MSTITIEKTARSTAAQRTLDDAVAAEMAAGQAAAAEVAAAATRGAEMAAATVAGNAERLQRWATIPVTTPIDLSIVIPAYNESKRIVSTIASIAAYVAPRHASWELIVADDGSSDDTIAKVERLGLVNVRVLHAERNQGKGSAVHRGIRAARGNVVLFSDADMSTPISALGDLLDSVTMGADVAVGSRALARTKAERSAVRRALTLGLRLSQQVLVPTGVKDTQCGFKLFRRDAALEILEHCDVLGFAFDIDMLYAAHRLGMKIDERPVDWVDAPGSKVRPVKHSLAFAREMLKIRARWERSHRGTTDEITLRLRPNV